MCFRGGGTQITRDICFPDGGSHITRDMCFPLVPHPCLPSHLTCILCLLLLPSIATLPPVSALPLCHCLPCPLFCVFYFNYSNHILHSLCFPFTLCPSLQAFSPFFPLFPSWPSFAMFFLLFKTPGPSCSKQG